MPLQYCQCQCTECMRMAQNGNMVMVMVIFANTMEQCSLFLPLLRGAGPMALMLWLNG
jgi:hypothetical protein